MCRGAPARAPAVTGEKSQGSPVGQETPELYLFFTFQPRMGRLNAARHVRGAEGQEARPHRSRNRRLDRISWPVSRQTILPVCPVHFEPFSVP